MPVFKESLKKIPRSLVFVILFGLAVRIAYLLIYAALPDWSILTVDNHYHLNWAKDIASGNLSGDTTYFRAPFYVYCLSFLYFLFGTSLWVPRIFGMVIGLISIFLTFRIAERLFNQKTAFIAGLIQAVFPLVLYFESEILLDSMFMLLLELALYRFLLWHDETTSKNSLWLGLAVGLAAITRPTILIFVLPIVTIAIIKKTRIQSSLQKLLVIAAGAAIVIAPITIRNALIGKEFVPISSQGGINFYIGNNSTADGLSALMPEPLGHNWQIKDISYIAEKDAGKDLKPGRISNFWYRQALNEISEEPSHFLKLLAKKFYFNFSNREISNNRNLNDFFDRHILIKYNPLSFGLIFALTVLAVITGWKPHWGVRLLCLTVLIYVFVSSLFFFNSRFRLPILPLYFILSAAGIESLVHKYKESMKLAIIPSVLAILAAVFAFAPLISLPPGIPTQQLTLIGLNHYFKNDLESALPYLKEAAIKDPEFPETNLNLGACYFRLNQVDSAFYYLNLEKKYHPMRALSYSNIAAIHLIEKRPLEALEEINRALELKPYFRLFHLIRMRAAADLTETFSNDSLYKLTISAINESEYALTVLNFSAITLTSRGAISEAKILLAKAITMAPPPIETNDDSFTPAYDAAKSYWIKDKALAHYQLGYIYGIEGHFEQSIVESQTAILLDPYMPEAYINLANGLNELGRYGEADSVVAVAKRLELLGRQTK